MDLLHHLGKRKRRIVTFTIPFQVFTYHIKTLQEESKKSNIPWIWRIIYGHKLPYMKKTKITLYEEDKKEEASMRCSLLHGSWDQILRRCPSVRLSVRPSGEVSGHLPENAWREWPEILHADVSWPSSELISLWPRSVDFSNFGAILT